MTGRARRMLAEIVGTGFLVVAVVGSGIAAARLSPADAGLQLLENSLATGAALTVLILALRPVSASFNPVVTVIERAAGLVSTADAGLLVAAQLVGAAIGVGIANLMFGLSVVSVSSHHRSGSGVWLGEVVATLGLVVIVFGTSRTSRPGRHETVALAVGGYIAAAYWFTSSTSFANPAVTLARSLSDTFAGIAPSSVAGFVGAQIVGGALGYALIRALTPGPDELEAPSSAVEVSA